MQSLILIVHVLASVSLIGLVLLQHGKGADVGASFGSGASNTMFGSQGSAPFLMKITGVLAAIFFLTSLGLSYLASRGEQNGNSLTKLLTQPTTSDRLLNSPAPVAPIKKT